MFLLVFKTGIILNEYYKKYWIHLSYHLKNYGDLGGCYPPCPTALADNIHPDLHNSSDDTPPHSIIVNCLVKA